MKPRFSHQPTTAFTLVELLCVIAIISILMALMLPVLEQGKARAKRIACINNLRQTGIAFQSFAHDHGDRFPMAVPMAEGGSREFVRNGYAVGGEFYFAFRQFQALSNDLYTAAVLICPADTRFPATNFGVLQNSNLSYFVGVKSSYSKPDSILAGDRNLMADSLPNPSILRIETNNPLRWTPELHQFEGNILFADGHVEEWNHAALAGAGSQQAGTDLFMPSTLPTPNVPAPDTTGYPNYSDANSGIATPPSPTPTPPTTPITPNPPPSTVTPASPPTRPANNPSDSQGRFSQETTGPGTQSQSDMAGKNPSGLFATNAPGGGTVTSEKTDSTTMTFDQRLAKTLRKATIRFYLLAWLIFLLWLLFAWRRRSRRKQAQPENQD
jgi:prepilin-type N-terminal cleavage/methylation domain-containing protein/prepilin-type processing-associated H-X9-DG protein